MDHLNRPLDLTWAQSQFPSLSGPWTFFDNAGGSQTLRGVVDRISEFLLERDVQIGGSYEISQKAAEALRMGRRAAQTLVNAERPEEIVFGHSTSVLVMTLAAAMRRQFSPGDEIVLCRADHESNIGHWERLSEFGVVIRWWDPDPTGRLSLADLEALLGDKTRLVCVHHVSNILGLINPIAEIAELAHRYGAKIVVDGVAFAPHRAIDVRAWNVDYYIFSIYKCYGAHTAVMYGKYELLAELDGLYHYFYGKEMVPGKLEPGNANYELNYAITAIVAYLAELGRRAGGTGDDRALLEAGYQAITAQEDVLTARLLSFLDAHPRTRVIGVPQNENSRRVPTVAFRIDGMNSKDVCAAMDTHHIAIRHGDFHSRRLVEALGEIGEGGPLRASLVHYNSLEQVDRLTAALDALCREAA